VDYQPSPHSFVELIEKAFERYAEKPCIRFMDASYSYAEVDRISSSIATNLIKKGFKKGNHAAIYSLNSAWVLIVTLGILRAGGVWIPINPRNSEIENIRALSAVGCTAIFHQDKFALAVDQVEEKSANLFIRVNLDQENFADHNISMAECINIPTAPEDLISLPMTGGTTGLPKCVMLTHANFSALAYGLKNWYLGYNDTPVILCVAPMTHVGGRIALTAMISGACVTVHEKFHAKNILETIQNENVTDLFLPPTGIYSLLEEPFLKTYDLTSLRNFLYGSAPISVEKLKQCLKVFGPVMREAYGQTESPLFIAGMAPKDHLINGEIASDDRLRSVGRATHLSEINILDNEGKAVPRGELGEIAAKGPMICQGYYNNQDETEKIRSGGWHLTGDIGYLDPDGFLYLMDRKKDMIITGGFNVYSAEVESIIDNIAGVRSSYVIGVPSERWGEEVKALVQKEPNSTLTEDHIFDICRKHLGSVKTPKSIEFRKTFPVTPLGKVDKKALKAAYWNKSKES